MAGGSGLLMFLLLASGCGKHEVVPPKYRPHNAHENYIHSLRMSGLAHTALAADWISASRRALRDPVDVTPPLDEISYVAAEQAFALGYRFDVIRGQKIEVRAEFQSRRPSRLFLDLFRAPKSPDREEERVASAAPEEARIEFEPRRDGRYIVRIQPELLRGGRCRVRITKTAALTFPVAGRDTRSIQSGFGEERDGGRRTHHGVDVFAPRHTPVLAAADAVVRFVGENRLGGNVIWLSDAPRSMNYYYAHLQTQEVEQGSRVKRGDRIGTVGNTGNARTTPPHLHFGIYPRYERPLDPVPFLRKVPGRLSEPSADLRSLGRWVRGRAHAVTLHFDSSGGSRRKEKLVGHTAMQVLAAAEDRYRVRLPDGRTGYVSERDVEDIREPLRLLSAENNRPVRDLPDENYVPSGVLRPGEPIRLLARYEEFWLVETERGRTGWLLENEEEETEGR